MKFDTHLSRVASRVRKLSATCPFGFWFVTDLHVPSNHGESAPLLERLVADTGLRAVVNPGSCAYFADFPEARFRLVVADTSDSVTTERPDWGVEETMSARQAGWLADNALATLPDGWNVVVASHIPLAGVAAGDLDKAHFAAFRATLEAFRLHGGGSVALALSGHVHAELQSCVAGIWHVSEPCDAAYLDYINRSAPWCPDLPVKERGTWAGQTFDAVQIDPLRGLVHFTRVGGGSDRTLHLRPLALRVGETLRLSTPHVSASQRTSGPVVWGAYDADRAVSRPNPARKYDRFTDYFHTVADVAPDGTLRALSPGEAVAVSRAADGVREYIPVTVTS